MFISLARGALSEGRSPSRTLSGRLGALSSYSRSARSNTKTTSGCLACTSSTSCGKVRRQSWRTMKIHLTCFLDTRFKIQTFFICQRCMAVNCSCDRNRRDCAFMRNKENFRSGKSGRSGKKRKEKRDKKVAGTKKVLEVSRQYNKI